MTARGFIVAAPGSGYGKTTVMLALISAFKRRGIVVHTAKAGPDYIDPAFHTAATGAPSVNLDSWAMPASLLDTLLVDAACDAELLLIEGVMGLFDGVAVPPGRTGATADLAAQFGLPVLLVLDVAGQSQSAAAVVRGFASHHPQVQIAGVLLNRVGSARHGKLVTDAIAALGIPVVGSLPRDTTLVLPERHLGLVQAQEHADLAARLENLADAAEQHFDIDAIHAIARNISSATSNGRPALAPPGQRIALASDAAFTFVYPHVLAGWRDAGAEIVTFSPLADEPPPDNCDCCWLPGGYPELHAGTLTAANNFRSSLAQFATTRPVHGECGGYMVLGEGLEDDCGVRHAMTGLLGHATSFAKRKLHLGYREAQLLYDCPLGRSGSAIRGHEFHYATMTALGKDQSLVGLVDGQGNAIGPSGGRRGFVTGTFFHAIAQQEPVQ